MTPIEIKQAWEDATGSCWPDEGCFTAGEYDHHLLEFARRIRNAALEEAAEKDAARFMWAMRNMANPFGRHEFGVAQHVIDRGGDGDIDDFRSYVDEMMEYDK